MGRFLLFAMLVACTDQTIDRTKTAPAAAPSEETPADPTPVADASAGADATSTVDASPDPPIDAKCTSTFGSAITAEFGRLDGRVRAVVVPGDFSCPGDDNHTIIQVDAGTSTYQIWVNVESDVVSSDTAIRFFEKKATFFPGGAWSAGWHPSPGRFDYALDLAVHSSSFTAMSKTAAASLIKERAKPGMRVAIYADGFTTNDGAHKVHRNSGGRDGAIVLDPTGTPAYLFFSFSTQTF